MKLFHSPASCSLSVVLNGLQFVGLDLADWPKLSAHRARVRARPAVQAAMKAVGLG